MEPLINGVSVTPLKRIYTPKGDVLHALKASDADYCGFGEAYFSEAKKGVRKGWKRHRRMKLNIVVVSGAIRFIIYDDRPNSDTRGKFCSVILSAHGVSFDDCQSMNECEWFSAIVEKGVYARLTVDPMLWMAFEGVADGTSILLDIIPELHNPEEADKLELSEIEYNL